MQCVDNFIAINEEREGNFCSGEDVASARSECTDTKDSAHHILDEFFLSYGNKALSKLVHINIMS